MADAPIVGSIKYVLDLDDDKYKKGLAEADRQADSFASKSSAYLNTATAASQRFALGLAGVALAVGGLATKFIQGAGEVELMRTNFDVLLGSAEKGKKLFGDLQKLANVTPFETSDLADASQTLLSFGIKSEKLIPILKNLGDVSLGNKEKFKQLALIFGQVSSAGKLQGQDLLQLINVGFNPLQKISERTGESMDSLRDKMQKGLITSGMVTDEFARASAEGGMFFKGMDRGAQTLQGVWSTMMDAVNTTTRGIVGLSATGEVIKDGLIDKVKNAVKGLTDYLTAHQQDILNFFTNGFSWIQVNGAIIVGIIIGGLVPALIALAGSVAAVLLPLLPFLVAGGALVLLFKKLNINMGDVVKGFDYLKNAFQGIYDLVVKGDFTKKFADIFGHMEEDSGAADVLFTIRDAFVSLFAELGKALKELLPPLKQLWSDYGPEIVIALKAIALVIGGVLIGAIFAIVSLLVIFVKTITLVVDTINKFKESGIRMLDFFKSLPAAIGGALSFLQGVFADFINTNIAMWNNLPYLIGFAAGSALKVVFDFVNGIHQYFVALPGNIMESLSLFWSTVTGWFNRTKTDSANTFNDMWNNVTSFFRNLPSNILAYLGSTYAAALALGNSIKNGIGDGLAATPGLLMNIINNMGKLLLDAGNSLYNAMKKVAGNIWQGFKDGLGIHSPSYIEEALTKIAGASKNTIKTVGSDMSSLANMIPISSPLAMSKNDTNPSVATSVIQNNKIYNQVDYDFGLSKIAGMLDARK